MCGHSLGELYGAQGGPWTPLFCSVLFWSVLFCSVLDSGLGDFSYQLLLLPAQLLPLLLLLLLFLLVLLLRIVAVRLGGKLACGWWSLFFAYRRYLPTPLYSQTACGQFSADFIVCQSVCLCVCVFMCVHICVLLLRSF